MEFADVVRRRRMVRAFTPGPLPPATVERVVETATRGPSAGNTHGTALLVLDAPADLDRFWTSVEEDAPAPAGLRTASLVLVPLASEQAYRERYARPDKAHTAPGRGEWTVPYWHVDAGMAALLALLAVVDEDLGALFFMIRPGALAAFRTAFGVPDAYVPVGAVAVGRPAPDAASRPSRARPPWRDQVHRGRWNGGRPG